MKSIYAQVWNENKENIDEIAESLNSVLIDKMIDNLECFLRTSVKSFDYYGDRKYLSHAFEEFRDVISDSENMLNVRDNSRFWEKNADKKMFMLFESKDIMYYCYLMSLKDKYEREEKESEETIEEIKPMTRTRIPNGMAPHKPYRS